MYIFFMFALVIYSGGIFCAITDNSLQSTRIYAPFIRRKVTPIGRLLLYPGWGSGFFYVLGMSFLILGVRLLGEQHEPVQLLSLAMFNFLMLPAAITRLMMRLVADAVNDRIAQVQIRRSHVNLGAQGFLAIGKLARAHARKQIEVFLHAAIAVGAFLAGQLGRAAIAFPFLKRKITNVRVAVADKLHGVIVQLLKITGRKKSFF